jgi:hypothetical protein
MQNRSLRALYISLCCSFYCPLHLNSRISVTSVSPAPGSLQSLAKNDHDLTEQCCDCISKKIASASHSPTSFPRVSVLDASWTSQRFSRFLEIRDHFRHQCCAVLFFRSLAPSGAHFPKPLRTMLFSLATVHRIWPQNILSTSPRHGPICAILTAQHAYKFACSHNSSTSCLSAGAERRRILY